MTDKQFKQLLSQGFIDNLIFFDVDAKATITKRLLYLMWGHCEDDIDYFYIPTDTYPDFDFTEKVYGAIVVRDKRLNKDGPILKHYEKLGAELPPTKQGLIIGVGKHHSVLGAV